MVRNFQRILTWLAVSGVFWIIGALAVESQRFTWWLIALAVEIIGPSTYFWVPGLGRSTADDWDVEGGHISERIGLFIIIALGESILVTGATFSELVWTTPAVGAFVASLVASIAMWWLYFDIGAEAGTHKISHSREPGKLARLAYTYIPLLMVAGIILTAVSDELVLHHPTGHSDGKTIVAVLGGPALYVAGLCLFKRVVIGRTPFSHLVGLGFLALLIPVGPHLAPLVLSLATTTILIAIAGWERNYCARAAGGI